MRFIVYCVTYTLSKMRRKIIVFPAYSYYLWFKKANVTIDNLSIEVLDPQKSINNRFAKDVSIIDLQLKSSPPWKSSFNSETSPSYKDDLLPIKDFLILLIKGEMFGFITPKNSTTNKIIYH